MTAEQVDMLLRCEHFLWAVKIFIDAGRELTPEDIKFIKEALRLKGAG